MPDTPSIKLQVRSDRPTATASQAYNSKVDALAFNTSFIAKYQPKLAIELLRLYARARVITENDPEAPDEDYALFADEVIKMARDSAED
jgi:ABC-type nitrate/sulfonate/bicarbonate transport system substrate-binding protein